MPDPTPDEGSTEPQCYFPPTQLKSSSDGFELQWVRATIASIALLISSLSTSLVRTSTWPIIRKTARKQQESLGNESEISESVRLSRKQGKDIRDPANSFAAIVYQAMHPDLGKR